MSTEHQKYSTENQADAIRAYAARRGIEIIRTYADQGKSGLSLDGRDALKRLIDDVQNGKTDFKTILVYDVSRWGRFQDADEGAYYEQLCKRAGISVQYCAEQFENDGGLASVVVKNLKRAVAGEYSRELSVKVFAGQCRLIELGYRQGGPPGYAKGRSGNVQGARRLKPGTEIVREYQGQRHTVVVTAAGFRWREGEYPSLTAIARVITGTSWNGPRFFGLRVEGESEGASANPSKTAGTPKPGPAIKAGRRPA